MRHWKSSYQNFKSFSQNGNSQLDFLLFLFHFVALFLLLPTTLTLLSCTSFNFLRPSSLTACHRLWWCSRWRSRDSGRGWGWGRRGTEPVTWSTQSFILFSQCLWLCHHKYDDYMYIRLHTSSTYIVKGSSRYHVFIIFGEFISGKSFMLLFIYIKYVHTCTSIYKQHHFMVFHFFGGI